MGVGEVERVLEKRRTGGSIRFLGIFVREWL